MCLQFEQKQITGHYHFCKQLTLNNRKPTHRFHWCAVNTAKTY